MARIDITLAQATAELNDSNTPGLDAELLLAHVLDKPRSYFFTWPEKDLTDQQWQDFQQLLEQRKKGIPVAYLIGEREFWSLTLRVNEATLIPRPDTELLVELALAQTLPDTANAKVLDLGTGTGAIALALAHEHPEWQLTAVDMSSEALTVARDNASLNHITNVRFLEGSWCEPVQSEQFDMIVSNPPYIRSDDHHLQQGDVRFEPITALASGADGLDDIRLIARQSYSLLKPGGWILMEHGYDQGEAVRRILAANHFIECKTKTDLSAQDRVTLARK